MRSSAQPVAIVTSMLHDEGSSATSGNPTSSSGPSPSKSQGNIAEPPSSPWSSSPELLVHGATLSSFVTLSLQPVPRVAFSLQMPSRMADSLLAGRALAGTRSCDASRAATDRSPRAHFVINVLSSSQSAVAAAFARPGLKPYDWSRHPAAAARSAGHGVSEDTQRSIDEEGDDPHPLEREELRASQHALHHWASSQGQGLTLGVPELAASLGWLSCSLEAQVDLSNDSGSLTAVKLPAKNDRAVGQSEGNDVPAPGSRLFIARVHHVEIAKDAEERDASTDSSVLGSHRDSSEDSSRLPLLYWRQQFCTVAAQK
ncbi:unnamed protein product [Parajaminaea phylloscopi]